MSPENIMLPLGSLLLVTLSGAVVKATNISGDPTDLANWPPCAVSFNFPSKKISTEYSSIIFPPPAKMHPPRTRPTSLMQQSFQRRLRLRESNILPIDRRLRKNGMQHGRAQPYASRPVSQCIPIADSIAFLEIEELSIPLCASVGGQPTSVVSAIESYLATASVTASGVPTSLPADATAVTAVSAILASATLTPNLGNPADISVYPLCAVSLKIC